MKHMKVIIFFRILPFILVLLFVNISGCAGQIEEKQENSGSGKVGPPPPSKSLPPGIARIEAQLIELNKNEDYIECIIKVEKVLQYGRSVKPIGSGTQLTLFVSNEYNDLLNILTEGTLKQKYEFTVEQEEVAGISSRQVKWKTIDIRDLQVDE